MNDNTDINWASMTDGAIMETIGKFVRHHRLNQNITQEKLAESANISRSTLSLIEKGEIITLPLLIQVLRVLDQLHIMEVFKVVDQISPMEYLKLKKNMRQRARNLNSTNKPKDDLGW